MHRITNKQRKQIKKLDTQTAPFQNLQANENEQTYLRGVHRGEDDLRETQEKKKWPIRKDEPILAENCAGSHSSGGQALSPQAIVWVPGRI